jgi:hypothetical protein
MVGRVVNADYRRDLNFLSRADYTRSRIGYTRIRVQPIAASTTGPYHARGYPLEQISLTNKTGYQV